MSLSADVVSRVKVAKGVNDLLNHYVTVFDTKASAFLAGNVAAASFLLREMPHPMCAKWLYFISLTFYATSVLMAGMTIFPRLPRSSKSVIFWGDISAHRDLETYASEFDKVIDSSQMDDQYIAQNFYTALVIKRKCHSLRWCISFFFIGLFASFPVFISAR
jgi:hypothetical protein